MASTLESELVEIFEREMDNLAMTNKKYHSTLGPSEIATIVDAFHLAIEHGIDKVTAQMLYDMIQDPSNPSGIRDDGER